MTQQAARVRCTNCQNVVRAENYCSICGDDLVTQLEMRQGYARQQLSSSHGYRCWDCNTLVYGNRSCNCRVPRNYGWFDANPLYTAMAIDAMFNPGLDAGDLFLMSALGGAPLVVGGYDPFVTALEFELIAEGDLGAAAVVGMTAGGGLGMGGLAAALVIDDIVDDEREEDAYEEGREDQAEADDREDDREDEEDSDQGDYPDDEPADDYPADDEPADDYGSDDYASDDSGDM